MENGYRFSDFHNFDEDEKICILRHDVDLSVDDALKIAELENNMGIKSTYYVLLNTEFYNLQYKPTCDKIKNIIELGHKIGLHFDAKLYDGMDSKDLINALKNEMETLSLLTSSKIESFSIHRPTKEEIESDIQLDGFINTYNQKFFKKFKYISDSRMRWRESPEEVIECGKYLQLQVLTHPIWYKEENADISTVLKNFLDKKSDEIYNRLKDNITNLDLIL